MEPSHERAARPCFLFCPWPSLDVPYKWPKFGARNGHSFWAREKMRVERMARYCFQKFLKLGDSLTLLSQAAIRSKAGDRQWMLQLLCWCLPHSLSGVTACKRWWLFRLPATLKKQPQTYGNWQPFAAHLLEFWGYDFSYEASHRPDGFKVLE